MNQYPQTNPETPSPEAYASEQDIAAFVRDSLDRLATTGQEYRNNDESIKAADDDIHYVVNVTYDADLTPSLPPYDKGEVHASTLEDGPDELKDMIFTFTSYMPHPQRGLVETTRMINLSGTGDTWEHTAVSGETPKGLEQAEDVKKELLKPEDGYLSDHDRAERISSYLLYLFRATELNDSIAEAEGMPNTERITYAELNDLRKLIPGDPNA